MKIYWLSIPGPRSGAIATPVLGRAQVNNEDQRHVEGMRVVEHDATDAEIEFLYSLSPGDPVEVYDEQDVIQMRGEIEITAPHLGIIWIRTDVGERRFFDIQEYLIRPSGDRGSPNWYYLVK